jgi:hypothetical protein
VRKGVLGFLLESLSQLSERDAPFTSSHCYLLVENLNIQKKRKEKTNLSSPSLFLVLLVMSLFGFSGKVSEGGIFCLLFFSNYLF